MSFLFKKNKLSAKNKEIDLDEILMDSKNSPGFDKAVFEGRMEFPLSKKSLKIIVYFFFIAVFTLFLKTFALEVSQGSYFEKRANNNSLKLVFTPPLRGEIYDRNGVSIVWNEPFVLNSTTTKNEPYLDKNATNSAYFLKELDLDVETNPKNFLRKYDVNSGLSNILGFIGIESNLKENNLSIEAKKDPDFKVGKDGLEKYYNERLKGKPGIKIMEVDSLRNLISYNIREQGETGEKINLTVDAKINSKLYELMAGTAKDYGFQGGSAVIMDVKSGEILALTNVPQYDSEVLSLGLDKTLIQSYLKNEQNIFLNRVVAGIYAPGSIIKPLISLAALNEGIISPNKVILTHGSISIPNPYSPGNYTVFRDWKNHGEVDMYKALAMSSDAYFYTIGGGNGDIRGLGINKIKKYAEMFGFNKKTGIDLLGEEEGVIPDPILKEKLNPENPVWRIGDTYHASIGQGNFQITPIEAAVYASALANKGTILTPYLVKDKNDSTMSLVKKLEIPEEYFNVAQRGMRMAVEEGTAKGLSDLNVKVAGKTGTAEIGKKYVNSWFIGFWPYQNPRYSITIVLERGSPHNLIGGVYVARQLLGWMQYNTPEYLK